MIILISIGRSLMHHKNKNFIEIQQPFDYLVIGHLTADMTEMGIRLGGTAAFSGLTAHALGLRTGVITSCSVDLAVDLLNPIWVGIKDSENSTTFRNVSDGVDRQQYLYQTAERLTPDDLPKMSCPPKILHLGPVANEVDPDILNLFPTSMKCLTAQGWFRKRNKDDRIELTLWDEWQDYLPNADATVVSIEDLQRDEDLISQMAMFTPVFAVTENKLGARVYWHGDARFFSAPEIKYADDTGAGDIFAAAFFYRYFTTKDPWEAGRFAVLLASWSVTRSHLMSIPTDEEISQAKHELIEG